LTNETETQPPYLLSNYPRAEISFAEINVGHEILRLELGLPTEHRSSPRNCLSCMRQAEDGHSFRGNVRKHTYVSGSETI